MVTRSIAGPTEAAHESVRTPAALDFLRFDGLYRTRLLSYATRHFGDLDPEDIVQETLLRALRHQDELVGRADPWPWLARVARNIGYDQLRVRGACRPAGIVPPDTDLDDPETLLENRADSAARRLALGHALAQMRGRRRRILELHDSAGFSCAEIADHLRTSPGAVRMQLMRARRELRQAFLDAGGRYVAVPAAALRQLQALLRRRGVAVPPWVSTVDPGISATVGCVAAGACAAVVVLTLGAAGGAAGAAATAPAPATAIETVVAATVTDAAGEVFGRVDAARAPAAAALTTVQVGSPNEATPSVPAPPGGTSTAPSAPPATGLPVAPPVPLDSVSTQAPPPPRYSSSHQGEALCTTYSTDVNVEQQSPVGPITYSNDAWSTGPTAGGQLCPTQLASAPTSAPTTAPTSTLMTDPTGSTDPAPAPTTTLVPTDSSGLLGDAG